MVLSKPLTRSSTSSIASNITVAHPQVPKELDLKVMDGQPHRNPFDDLPIETLQHIASSIEGDTDLCHYRLVCRSTLDAVDADNGSFWRRRFREVFEECLDLKNLGSKGREQANEGYKKAYQRRRGGLKRGAVFRTGEGRRERECLEILRDLVCDAFSEKKSEDGNEMTTYQSANLQHLFRFLQATNLLQTIFEPPKAKASRFNSRRSMTNPPPAPTPTPLLYTIQVLCAPLLLSVDPMLEQSHFGFPDCQAAVYATTIAKPVFGGCYGLDVNMEFVLQNINFWRYHMTREHENTLFYAFSELLDCERPRWWAQQLSQSAAGRALGKYWKGSYAYIEREEIDLIRRGKADCDQVQDYFAGEDHAFSFQNMRLQVLPEESPVTWPRVFEQILHSLTPPASTARTRAQKRSATPDAVANFKPLSFQFSGSGMDVQEDFLAAGWLNPLPPQQGVPGWQRLTMMKYFELDSGDIDVDALWAYEGVVLPGGQIVVGRWWSPGDGVDDGMYSGPFILWCVDGPGYEDVENDDMETEE